MKTILIIFIVIILLLIAGFSYFSVKHTYTENFMVEQPCSDAGENCGKDGAYKNCKKIYDSCGAMKVKCSICPSLDTDQCENNTNCFLFGDKCLSKDEYPNCTSISDEGLEIPDELKCKKNMGEGIMIDKYNSIKDYLLNKENCYIYTNATDCNGQKGCVFKDEHCYSKEYCEIYINATDCNGQKGCVFKDEYCHSKDNCEIYTNATDCNGQKGCVFNDDDNKCNYLECGEYVDKISCDEHKYQCIFKDDVCQYKDMSDECRGGLAGDDTKECYTSINLNLNSGDGYINHPRFGFFKDIFKDKNKNEYKLIFKKLGCNIIDNLQTIVDDRDSPEYKQLAKEVNINLFNNVINELKLDELCHDQCDSCNKHTKYHECQDHSCTWNDSLTPKCISNNENDCHHRYILSGDSEGCTGTCEPKKDKWEMCVPKIDFTRPSIIGERINCSLYDESGFDDGSAYTGMPL